jgi:hypothetical protein
LVPGAYFGFFLYSLCSLTKRWALVSSRCMFFCQALLSFACCVLLRWSNDRSPCFFGCRLFCVCVIVDFICYCYCFRCIWLHSCINGWVLIYYRLDISLYEFVKFTLLNIDAPSHAQSNYLVHNNLSFKKNNIFFLN